MSIRTSIRNRGRSSRLVEYPEAFDVCCVDEVVDVFYQLELGVVDEVGGYDLTCE
jgi:hypothetical protein